MVWLPVRTVRSVWALHLWINIHLWPWISWQKFLRRLILMHQPIPLLTKLVCVIALVLLLLACWLLSVKLWLVSGFDFCIILLLLVEIVFIVKLWVRFDLGEVFVGADEVAWGWDARPLSISLEIGCQTLNLRLVVFVHLMWDVTQLIVKMILVIALSKILVVFSRERAVFITSWRILRLKGLNCQLINFLL